MTAHSEIGAEGAGGRQAASRMSTVFSLDALRLLRRPMLWTQIVILGLATWGLSTGNLRISSGAVTVGGKKAWITSEFSAAYYFALLTPMLFAFFSSIVAGLAVSDDDEAGVSPLLHSTRLRPGEYVWAKVAAVAAVFTGLVALLIAMMVFFFHVLPNPKVEEIRGPLDLLNYLRPALVFALPTLAFYVGIAFYLGERWRRQATALLFPLFVVIASAFFLWNWSPSWLDPGVNRLLMLIDPAGLRWLSETWLKVDRGADFYNTARVGIDLPFAGSRLAIAAIGVAAVALAHRHFARTLRGGGAVKAARPKRRPSGSPPHSPDPAPTLKGGEGRPLPITAVHSQPVSGGIGGIGGIGAIGAEGASGRQAAMESTASGRQAAIGSTASGRQAAMEILPASPPGFVAATLTSFRTELATLARRPALYFFAFFILTQSLSRALLAVGSFDTPLLLTPGILAAGSFNTLTLLVCLLTLFFLVESLERERTSGLAPLAYSSPVSTAALVAGKILGIGGIAVALLAANWIGGTVALFIQGKGVAPDPRPFVLLWGLLLLPTFLLWTSFVAAVEAITRNRYLTYSIGLGAIAFTLYRQFTDGMNWVGNWMLWDAVRWSDLSVLELDRKAFVLNRLAALALAVFFLAVAARAFPRRGFDAIGLVHRLRPRPLARGALRLAPWAAVPLALGIVLWLAVLDGRGGEEARRRQKNYWKQNVATWKDAPQPSLSAVDLALDLEPATSGFHTRGSYRMVNATDGDLRAFALTGGRNWRDLAWTLDGAEAEPENRSGLYVFTPERPLAPGDAVEVGFDFHGRYPDGISENGGGPMTFILPSAVVLTSFTPDVLPVVGYMEEIGIDEDNESDPKEYPPDHYRKVLRASFGSQTPFTTRIAVTAPADFTVNSVGTLASDTVAAGRRTSVWVSDHPVRFWNVVAGRWEVRRGEGTAIYYDRRHAYNIDEMSRMLDGARRWYSEWFYPFPWRELKLSEFPGVAFYAQGFPTNITFSEGIGFLTRSDPKVNSVMLVTAHESAHQWWGNLLTPGEGPGGNLLSEGMSHFSTMLLAERLAGEHGRMEFAKRIEERYGDDRRPDAERPLVEIDGSQPGDTTVTYDKCGWVVWMLMETMGRDNLLAGLRQFIAERMDGPDYPLLEDLIETLRPHAPDPEAFDRFVGAWFFRVEVPEYRFAGARTEELPAGGGWRTTATIENRGTGAMPIEVAAVAGDRFDDDGKPKEGYREGRTTVTLAAGGTARVEIVTEFKPERLVADPDVRVLQLERNAAEVKL